jgi:hypothetical protein
MKSFSPTNLYYLISFACNERCTKCHHWANQLAACLAGGIADVDDHFVPSQPTLLAQLPEPGPVSRVGLPLWRKTFSRRRPVSGMRVRTMF